MRTNQSRIEAFVTAHVLQMILRRPMEELVLVYNKPLKLDPVAVDRRQSRGVEYQGLHTQAQAQTTQPG